MTYQHDPRPKRADRTTEPLDARHYGDRVEPDDPPQRDDVHRDDRPVPDDVGPAPDYEPEQDRDDGADGTLVETGGVWHHSTAFDGYEHTITCGRVLACVDVDDVHLSPLQALRELDADPDATVCTECRNALLCGGSGE